MDSKDALQARQTLEETRWLLELADRAPFILGVIGWVDLRRPRLHRDLRLNAGRSKLVGIRHIVQSEPDDHFLLQLEFLRGIRQNHNLSEGWGGPRKSHRWLFFYVPMRLHSLLAWIILWTVVS